MGILLKETSENCGDPWLAFGKELQEVLDLFPLNLIVTTYYEPEPLPVVCIPRLYGNHHPNGDNALECLIPVQAII